MKSFTATEAKNNFGVVLASIDSGIVEIVKNGKAAAYVLSPREFAAMGASHSQARLRRSIQAGDARALGVLRQFSAGKIDKHRAMRDLGLASQAQLLDALGVAALPLPMVPPAELKRMVAGAMKALGAAAAVG